MKLKKATLKGCLFCLPPSKREVKSAKGREERKKNKKLGQINAAVGKQQQEDEGKDDRGIASAVHKRNLRFVKNRSYMIICDSL